MIRRCICLLCMAAAAAGCGRNIPALESGDLLFQAGKGTEMAGAIAAATGAARQIDYTHVGIALCANGADSVLEASTEGVRTVALKDFLAEAGSLHGRPAEEALRLRDTRGQAASLHRDLNCGLPYDYSFRPDNGRLYCSELVWESYRRTDGTPVFPARPMNFRAADGTMPRYWVALFEKLGEPIPEGEPGTNPNEMARDPQLREVGRWF